MGRSTPTEDAASSDLLLATLIARGALLRRESRGAHFRTDFPNVLTLHKLMPLTLQSQKPPETKTNVNVEAELLIDHAAKSEFIAFYIPDTPLTFDVCDAIAQMYKVAFTIKEGIAVEGGFRGERLTSLKELQFTKRIYIYHENPLLTEQKDKIEKLFKRKKLSLILRGSDYAFDRNNPPATPFRFPEQPSPSP